MKRIVGILQNTWARDPDRVRLMLDRHPRDWQRRYETCLLFMGCLTGRRLRAAFRDLTNRIVWTNACSDIGGKSNSCPPVDAEFLQREMVELSPDIVLLFGQVAARVFDSLKIESVAVIRGPHPASRKTDVAMELSRMFVELNAVDK